MNTLHFSHTEPSRNGWQVANEAPDTTCCAARSILATVTGTIVWVPICLPSPSQQVCTVAVLSLAAAPPSPARELCSQPATCSLQPVASRLHALPGQLALGAQPSLELLATLQCSCEAGPNEHHNRAFISPSCSSCFCAALQAKARLISWLKNAYAAGSRCVGSRNQLFDKSRETSKNSSPESVIRLDALADLDLQPSLPIAEGLLHVRLLLRQGLLCERHSVNDAG